MGAFDQNQRSLGKRNFNPQAFLAVDINIGCVHALVLAKRIVLSNNGASCKLADTKMTKIFTAHIGSYPRIGEEKDQQRHRRALNHLQNKLISAIAFRDVEQSVIQEIIREQIDAGLDFVTDGCVPWQDPISSITSRLSGIATGGLTRYFDTNFCYRIPRIVSKPKRTKPILLGDFQFAQSVSNKPVRVILTGPYTLACHTQSDIKSLSKMTARTAFFTEVLQQEIIALVNNGARFIQIDEPSLGLNTTGLSLVQKSLIAFHNETSKKGAQLILALSYSPLAALFEKLIALPIDGLNLDLTYDWKKITEKISSTRTSIALGLGIVNARTTLTDTLEPILKFLHTTIDKTSPSTITLTPSTGLEYLPRDAAIAKLKLLVKIKDECHILFGTA